MGVAMIPVMRPSIPMVAGAILRASRGIVARIVVPARLLRMAILLSGSSGHA
jgi:hypothetical protein